MTDPDEELPPVDPAEVRWAVDEVALRRLLATYADAVTRRAWDEVAAHFAPGCPIELDLRDAGTRHLEGGEELAAFVAGAVERFAFFAVALLNVVVVPGPDPVEATGRVYVHELRQDHEGGWSDAVGLYRDRYVRTADGWRFADRRYATLARTAPDGVGRVTFDVPG